jgi:hypothetical protein
METMQKCSKLEGKLAKQLKETSDASKKLSASLSGKHAEPNVPQELRSQVSSRLSADTKLQKDVKQVLPQAGDWYLSLFLGKSISVIFSSKDRKFGFKAEYESFKQKLNLVALFLSVVTLLTHSRATEVIFQLFAVYYYTALVLREIILKANGTDIKPWWIRHHYLSIMATTVFLTWPATPLHDAFQPQFFIYASVLSLVQVLQTAYQQARLYPRRVLGKSQMETVWGELPIWYSRRGLALLVPCLLGMYSFQFYNAYSLLVAAWKQNGEWQAWCLASAFIVAATGNTVTLLTILLRKFINKRKGIQSVDSPSTRTAGVSGDALAEKDKPE